MAEPKARPATRGPRHAAGGQAMIEFLYAFAIAGTLILAALQFGLLYMAKTTLNYASFEAARSGALNSARPVFIENALARGLAALYTHDDTVEAVKRGRCVVRADLYGGDARACMSNADAHRQLPAPAAGSRPAYARIEILNPLPEHFDPINHGIATDEGFEIPNDNLMYRPPVIRAGVNVQDANLLKLRVTYCYPMVVPFINRAIAALMRELHAPAPGSLEQRCLDAEPNPRLPVVAQAIVRMHSPAFKADASAGPAPAPSPVVWGAAGSGGGGGAGGQQPAWWSVIRTRQ